MDEETQEIIQEMQEGLPNLLAENEALKMELELKNVKRNLNLKGKTARIRFIELKDGRMGFYAESYKTKQSVSIELTKKDIANLLAFLRRLKPAVSSEVS